jgi:hydrogenase-4 component B
MTAFSVVLLAGLVLLAAAAGLDLGQGTGRLRLRPGPYLLAAAGSVCLATAGAAALAGRPVALRASGLLGPGTAIPAADRLSGLFLVIAFGAAVPVSLALASWATRAGYTPRRGLAAVCALALGSVAVVLIARDAFTLLFAWETLTLSFYLVAGFERQRSGRPASAFITLAFGRVSGVCLLAGLLLLAARAGTATLPGLAQASTGALRITAEILLLTGFVVKVGLVPFQVWLPRGYAAAPGPARAIMAGVAVNVGFYGLWRTLELLGPPPAAVTGILLILAGMTALLGIAHAAVQTGLQRVIAYSSVENSGLILAGFGVALVGAATRDAGLLAAGLLAATLQVIAHTVAKSLLFTSSAFVQAGDGSDNLDDLRGTVRSRPWSATGLAIGSLTLAGLPPTAGFVSEWFLLESLMQQFRVPGLGDRLVLAVTGAAVALTAGFAGVTFVRLIGLVVLGKPEGSGRRPAADYGLTGRAAVAVLGVACLAIAAVTPLEIRVIAAGLSPVVPGRAVLGALKSPWVLQPVFAGFSILSPSWLWIVMPALFCVVVLGVWALSGKRLLRVRRVQPWLSATAGVSGRDSYTAFGFANPTRRVLASVLHTRVEVGGIATAVPADATAGPPGAEAAPAAVRPAAPAGDGTADPHVPDAPVPHIAYRSDVIEVVEQYVYRPVRRPFLRLVRLAKRLQSGRLDAYLAYMLIALIAVLAVVTAVH